MALKDGDYYATEFPGTTAGLQAAIDYLASGKGKIWIGPGTVTITTAILPTSDITIMGSGRATVLSVSGGVECFTLSSDNRVEIRDMKIDCVSQTGANHAISLTTCSDCILDNLVIADATARAIFLTVTCLRNTISNIHITHDTNVGSQGVVINNGSNDNILRDFRIYNTGDSAQEYGVWINNKSHRNRVENGYVYRSYATGYQILGTSSGSGCDENIFVNCIADQAGEDDASPGFSLDYYCCGNKFIGCVARASGWSTGADTACSGFQAQRGCHSTQFIGCQTYYTGGYGIEFDQSDFVAVSNCIVQDSQDPGIRLEDAYYATITGNICRGNSGGGIRLRNLSTNKTFAASDFAQVGSGNVYKSTHATINSATQPVVRAEENGKVLGIWPAQTRLSANADASTTLTVVSSGGLTAGDVVVVSNRYRSDRNTATTISSVDSATQITVATAQTGERGDEVLWFNATDLGDIDGRYYINRASGALYVMLSDKSAPIDNEVTAGAGCPFATVTGNNCNENGESGILLEGSSYCVVSGNTCSSNGTIASSATEPTNRCGIMLRDGDGNEACSYNSIVGNACTDLRPSSPTDQRQQLYGVYLEDANCTNNQIEGNVLYNNKTGAVYATGTVANGFTFKSGLGTAIASAATIAIPTDGSVFHITGTTNITNGVTVNPWDTGRTVTLIFDGILTMSDTGTSVLSAAYITTANDTLTLSCDGTNWYEVSRSAN